MVPWHFTLLPATITASPEMSVLPCRLVWRICLCISTGSYTSWHWLWSLGAGQLWVFCISWCCKYQPLWPARLLHPAVHPQQSLVRAKESFAFWSVCPRTVSFCDRLLPVLMYFLSVWAGSQAPTPSTSAFGTLSFEASSAQQAATPSSLASGEATI